MAENSKIEWCHHTANFWSGCTKVSPACEYCYAEALAKRNTTTFGKWGKGAPRQWHGKTAMASLRRWNKHAAATTDRPRVFINSLSDWLDDEVPLAWLGELLEAIREFENLDFLLLSKRLQNFDSRMSDAMPHVSHDTRDMMAAWSRDEPPHNVWIGTTAENQRRADERIPLLLDIPATVRFLSCEPLLGPLDLPPSIAGGIHWIICGGESGAHARPMHPAWARSLRNQAAGAGIPFLFKQWGEWLPLTPLYAGRDEEAEDGCNPDRCQALYNDGKLWDFSWGQPPVEGHPWITERTGKKVAGRLLDGVLHDAFPR